MAMKEPLKLCITIIGNLHSAWLMVYWEISVMPKKLLKTHLHTPWSTFIATIPKGRASPPGYTPSLSAGAGTDIAADLALGCLSTI
jgi:hypothetical protein